MRSVCFFILITLLLSCKPHRKDLINIDPRQITDQKIALRDLADSIYYIPLDNQYQIGLIQDQIRFVNNSIYFLVSNEGIFECDKEGKFLRKIGKPGRGPGEINYFNSFSIDERNKTIYIVDGANTIKVFSKTGRFLRTISLTEYGDMINAIEYYNSNLIVIFPINYESTQFDWITFDSLGVVIRKETRNSSGFITNALPLAGIFKHGNQLSFWNNYSDTIFSISPDFSFKPSFIISQGEHRLPKSRISAETMSMYIWFQQIFETKQYIFLRYFYPSTKFELVVIDKRTGGKSLVIMKLDESGYEWLGGIKNDLDDGLGFLPRTYFTENGREFVAGVIYPHQIMTHVNTDKFKNSIPKLYEKKKELEKLAASLKETDNPILVIVRLKK